jgi:colicin import membrane protein
VVGAIRPNIVFTDVVQGNPAAEVEVTTNPAGDIVGRKLRSSSGSPAWDEAVLRAIDRTGALPRDTNGRVPSPMLIRFKPKD